MTCTPFLRKQNRGYIFYCAAESLTQVFIKEYNKINRYGIYMEDKL